MGRWGIRNLETRVGQECSISRGGPDSTVEVYVSEESEEGGSHSDTARGGEAPRALKLDKESCEHLR